LQQATIGKNEEKLAKFKYSNLRNSAAFEKSGLALMMIVVAILLTILTHGLYLSGRNIINIFVQSSMSGMVAVGMTFVIITAGIDLSVAGNATLCAISASMILRQVAPDNFIMWLLVIILAILLGGLVGLINGMAVTVLKMVPFVTTLALLNITRGTAKTISNAQTIQIVNNYHSVFGMAKIGGVLPVSVIMLLVVATIGFILLNKTRFGREIYAVGGNEKAAWLAGINTKRVIATAYVISGICASLAGVLITSQLMGCNSQIGTNMELDAIAACVIGGTSLMGGEGGIVGTVMGAIVIAMINIGLNLTGVSPFAQEIAKGGVIFSVVALDAIRRTNAKKD
jgi:ribose transport system permease protein